MERRVRHRHTKGAVTDGPLLYITAPTLDPTAAHFDDAIASAVTEHAREQQLTRKESRMNCST
jgi:hypothetical protein